MKISALLASISSWLKFNTQPKSVKESAVEKAQIKRARRLARNKLKEGNK